MRSIGNLLNLGSFSSKVLEESGASAPQLPIEKTGVRAVPEAVNPADSGAAEHTAAENTMSALRLMAQLRGMPPKVRLALRGVHSMLNQQVTIFGLRLPHDPSEALRVIERNPSIEKLRLGQCGLVQAPEVLRAIAQLPNLRAVTALRADQIEPLLKACPTLEKLDVSGIVGLSHQHEALAAIAQHPGLRDLTLPAFRGWRNLPWHSLHALGAQSDSDDEDALPFAPQVGQPIGFAEFFKMGLDRLERVRTVDSGMISHLIENNPLDDETLAVLAEFHPGMKEMSLGLTSLEAVQRLSSFDKLESLDICLADIRQPPDIQNLRALTTVLPRLKSFSLTLLVNQPLEAELPTFLEALPENTASNPVRLTFTTERGGFRLAPELSRVGAEKGLKKIGFNLVSQPWINKIPSPY